MKGDDARRAIDAVWKIESARLIAGLARIAGDVGPSRLLLGPGELFGVPMGEALSFIG